MISRVEFEEIIQDLVGQFLRLSDMQVALLMGHMEQLLKWNRHLNLTSVRDEKEMVRRHYCESLYLASLLPTGLREVTDIGSGAGFPGFPVAVARPGLIVRLLESDKRKAAFLRECRGRIPSIHIENARSAEYSRSSEFWVCRAVKAAEAIECCGRLGGRLALMLSADDAKKLTESGVLVDASTTPLPWKPDSVILMGEPKKRVPRGTREA